MQLVSLLDKLMMKNNKIMSRGIFNMIKVIQRDTNKLVYEAESEFDAEVFVNYNDSVFQEFHDYDLFDENDNFIKTI